MKKPLTPAQRKAKEYKRWTKLGCKRGWIPPEFQVPIILWFERVRGKK